MWLVSLDMEFIIGKMQASLRKTHTVVEISRAQMGALSGNALEVQDGRGLPAMAMSTQVCGSILNLSAVINISD
jgi:hypothetical protein